MNRKRFTDNGIEDIENQSFTDNLTGKTYWIDNGLDGTVDLLNSLNDENEQLKVTLSNYMRQIDKLYIGRKLLEQQLLFIDKLMNDLGSEEMRRQYNEIIGAEE